MDIKNPKKIAEIIKNLFAHAESATSFGSFEEAKTATARAKALMDKFNISKADLLDSATETNSMGLSVIDYDAIKALYSKNRQDWFVQFCNAVGITCGVKIQLLGFGTSCRIFGCDEESAEAAKNMLDGLLRMANLFYNTLRKTEVDLKRADYLRGFADAVYEKANEPREVVTKDALMKLSDSLSRRIESLILSQADGNKQVGNAALKSRDIDQRSYLHGVHDGNTRENVRI